MVQLSGLVKSTVAKKKKKKSLRAFVSSKGNEKKQKNLPPCQIPNTHLATFFGITSSFSFINSKDFCKLKLSLEDDVISALFSLMLVLLLDLATLDPFLHVFWKTETRSRWARGVTIFQRPAWQNMRWCFSSRHLKMLCAYNLWNYPLKSSVNINCTSFQASIRLPFFLSKDT